MFVYAVSIIPKKFLLLKYYGISIGLYCYMYLVLMFMNFLCFYGTRNSVIRRLSYFTTNLVIVPGENVTHRLEKSVIVRLGNANIFFSLSCNSRIIRILYFSEYNYHPPEV